MPFLYVRAVNSVFETRDEGCAYERPEDALSAGVRSAVAMVSEDVSRGSQVSAIEVCVEDADETPVLRAVVSLSVAPLHVS